MHLREYPHVFLPSCLPEMVASVNTDCLVFKLLVWRDGCHGPRIVRRGRELQQGLPGRRQRRMRRKEVSRAQTTLRRAYYLLQYPRCEIPVRTRFSNACLLPFITRSAPRVGMQVQKQSLRLSYGMVWYCMAQYTVWYGMV